MKPATFQSVRKMTWDADVSTGLLTEEIAEFWEAFAREDLVEMLDAFADIWYVVEGRQFLFGSTKMTDFAHFANEKVKYDLIMAYGRQTLNLIRAELEEYNPKINPEFRQKVIDIVSETNGLKSLKHNAQGKVEKPVDWVSPQAQIKELLTSHNIAFNDPTH